MHIYDRCKFSWIVQDNNGKTVSLLADRMDVLPSGMLVAKYIDEEGKEEFVLFAAQEEKWSSFWLDDAPLCLCAKEN